MPDSNSAAGVCPVGSILRESRTSLGISLEEAARVTRIGKNYLAALEEGRFDTLPNIAYVKGFLRAYATYLGLSGDEIVALYERAVSPSPHQPAEMKREGGDSGPMEMKASRRGRWFVSILLLVLVIGAAYIFEDKGPRPVSPPFPADAPPSVPVAASVQPPRSSAQRPPESAELHPDKRIGDGRPANADSRGGGIVLKLKVNQDSWLNITIDDAVSQQYDLKAGDLIEWKGDRVFALDLGNGGGCEAEFNGKPLKPFGVPGKPAHVVLKADGAPPEQKQ